MIISIAALIFTLTCPGNTVRFAYDEINALYPIYGELSFMQKVIIGITVLFNYITIKNSPIYAFTAIFYVLIIFLNFREKFIYRLISLIPFFGFVFCFLFGFVPEITKRLSAPEKFDGLALFNQLLYKPIFFIIIMLILCSYLFCFHIVVKNITKNMLMYLIIISGFLSQLAMSFSPTIHVSGIRTAILLFIVLAIAGTEIFSRYYGQRFIPIIISIIASTAVLSIILSTVFRL
jgi:hypothetical protein